MSASDSDTPGAAASAQRVPLLPREEWTDAARDVFEFWGEPNARENGSATTSVMTMAQHPELAKAYFAIGWHVVVTSTLPLRAREIATLRVAWRLNSEYEWHYHVGYAVKLGMTLDEIGALRDDPATGGWNEIDRAVIDATDELFRNNKVSQPTWDVLARHFDRRQMMDLVITIGHYVMTGWAFDTFGVQVEDGVDQVGFDLRTRSGKPVRALYKPGEVDDWQAANA